MSKKRSADQRVLMMSGERCIAIVNRAEVARLAEAPNVERIYKRKTGELIELQVRDMGDDSREPSRHANAQAYVFREAMDGMAPIFTLKHIPWQARPAFLRVVTGRMNFILKLKPLVTNPAAAAAAPTPTGLRVVMSDGTIGNYTWAQLAPFLPAGPTGPQGATGAAGATGNTGAQGIQGYTGQTGAQGIQGLPGVTGPTGPSGSTGPAGPSGSTGACGSTGAQGPQGVNGTAGPAGAIGPAGLTWRGQWVATIAYNVHDVVSYYDGNCFVCIVANTHQMPDWTLQNPVYWATLAAAGLPGAAGPLGPQGLQGTPGIGLPGQTGATGPTGPSVISWQGAYTTLVNYSVGQIVYYNACAWIAIAPSANVPPSGADGNPWSLFAGGQFASLILPFGMPSATPI